MPFGIGIEHVKSEVNVASLCRAAYNLGAAFVFTVGLRYQPRGADTVKAYRHFPIWHFKSWDQYRETAPFSWVPVGVEIAAGAVPLEVYTHPRQAVYWLGPEDGSLSNAALGFCKDIIQIPSRLCLNVAVAGSIVMYDRLAKQLLSKAVIREGG